MGTHFETIMHRYKGRIDRWDVVTEVLRTQGGGLHTENDFSPTNMAMLMAHLWITAPQ